jgi:hypothetical protein
VQLAKSAVFAALAALILSACSARVAIVLVRLELSHVSDGAV